MSLGATVSEKNCHVDGAILLLQWRTVKEFYFVV
jgi:hypothetical protein